MWRRAANDVGNENVCVGFSKGEKLMQRMDEERMTMIDEG
jgi:hypothetical protein